MSDEEVEAVVARALDVFAAELAASLSPRSPRGWLLRVARWLRVSP